MTFHELISSSSVFGIHLLWKTLDQTVRRNRVSRLLLYEVDGGAVILIHVSFSKMPFNVRVFLIQVDYLVFDFLDVRRLEEVLVIGGARGFFYLIPPPSPPSSFGGLFSFLFLSFFYPFKICSIRISILSKPSCVP